MSRRIYIAIAFILAIVATVVGWSQSLSYKDTPPVPLALWFPLVVMSPDEVFVTLAVSFVQFPLFAWAFAVGIRRWSVARVVAVLALTYTLLASVALVIV